MRDIYQGTATLPERGSRLERAAARRQLARCCLRLNHDPDALRLVLAALDLHPTTDGAS